VGQADWVGQVLKRRPFNLTYPTYLTYLTYLTYMTYMTYS